MDSNNRTPEDLIDDITAFLERERELFGAFEINTSPPARTTDIQGNHTGNNGDEKDSSDEEEKMVANEEEQSKKYQIEVEHPLASGFDASPSQPGEAPYENKSIEEQLAECTTLEELRELCAKTDVLKTDLEDTNLVFGVGNPNADLMLIGEAPGEEEDRQGEPFVGKAGRLLNKILEAIDFSREDVYIANILKHRPPNNRDPKPEEREQSLPFLVKQIEIINPKLILSLGKVSAQTLLNSDETLGRMRGKFHPFMDKYELMATYHPAALLRHKKWKRPTWEDVKALRKRYDELECKP